MQKWKGKLEFQEVFETVNSCSDHKSKLTAEEVKGAVTLAAFGKCNCEEYNPDYKTCGSYCDTYAFAVARLKDGRFAVAWESSDTTGHGCQCSGAVDDFKTLGKAIDLGLDDEQRKAVRGLL